MVLRRDRPLSFSIKNVSIGLPGRYKNGLSSGRPLPPDYECYLACKCPLVAFREPAGQTLVNGPICLLYLYLRLSTRINIPNVVLDVTNTLENENLKVQHSSFRPLVLHLM